MKQFRKVFSMFLALAMVFAVAAPAFAQEVQQDTTTQVTLHKLLMTQEELNVWDIDGPEGYDGTQDLAGLQNLDSVPNTLTEIAGVYFAFQNEQGQWINAQGTVVETAQDALGGLTTENGLNLNTSELPQDTSTVYRIQEVPELSTYQGGEGQQLADSRAVPVEITLPFVNQDGVQTEVHVYPKNTEERPEIDKNFAEGTEGAEDTALDYADNQREKDTVDRNVGDVVEYQVGTLVPQNSNYQTLRWTDIMTDGLTFNNDLQVLANGVAVDSSWYTVQADDRGFTLTLTEAGLTEVEALAENSDVTIRLEYSATVNNDAVVDIPESNDIKLDYSNRPSVENEPTPVYPTDTTLDVNKTWSVDGNNDNSTPDNVTAVFSLYSVVDGVETLVETVRLDNNTGFNYTFTGLDNDTQYVVRERIAGYTPEYTTEEDGNVTLNNDRDTDYPQPLDPSEPQVVTGGRRFVKTNQDGTERLAGARFYVRNQDGQYLVANTDEENAALNQALEAARTNLDQAVEAYNTRENDDNLAELQDAVNNAQEAYNEAFEAARTSYTWADTDDNALELVSDAQGRFEITGLAYGTYELLEVEAPQGYALPADQTFEFTVAAGSYAGNEAELEYTPNTPGEYAQQIVNRQVTIPQTGGMGTLLFTVAGILLILGSLYAMKKSRDEEKELA